MGLLSGPRGDGSAREVQGKCEGSAREVQGKYKGSAREVQGKQGKVQGSYMGSIALQSKRERQAPMITPISNGCVVQ
ncbi:hypothetical protein AML91_07535 [Paenibacillus jilunlii]|uniref:Uncharacterized protein n=1 Tax=Paenibacillus jilunlii TaxID=682956 RepID=A0ABR5SZ61_9BACL|nr:hypothetical protein AML91_07535 [Paenibacillus jilunlii]